MLRRASEVAILDAFPARAAQLEDDLTAAAGRGVLVALNAYAPTEIEGVEVARSVHGDRTRRRWPGDWLNLVVDGREFLIAFLDPRRHLGPPGDLVRKPLPGLDYHSALSSELILNVLEDLIEQGASAERLRSETDPSSATESPARSRLPRTGQRDRRTGNSRSTVAPRTRKGDPRCSRFASW